MLLIGIVIFYVHRRRKCTKQSDTHNSVHDCAEQQQRLLSSISTNNSVHYSAEQQGLVSSTSDFEFVLDAGAYRGAAGHANSNRRHAAYDEFILQHHGHLGTGNRRVIPSCCIWKIRDKYPDRYKQYRGFVENKQHNKTMND